MEQKIFNEVDIKNFKKNYDWVEAFKYGSNPTKVAESLASTDSFSIENVKNVICFSEGENDGADWICVVELDDGRFASLSAWCDYTGWGCREGGRSNVGTSLQEILQFGLDDEQRNRLGI